MDAGDHRMIVHWVLDVLADQRIESTPTLYRACHALMDRSWSRLHPKAKPTNETHAKTRETS